MGRSSLQDRIMITSLAEAGYSDRQIAAQVGWSVPTVRKWRRRSRQRGADGTPLSTLTLLANRLGRPPGTALGTFPPAVRELLRAWRTAHPGWGPKTLRAELAVALPEQPLPSRASIARWLRATGLTRRYERHQALPQAPHHAAQAPHEVWQLDAQGAQHVAGVGQVALINLVDVCSKAKLLSYPCWLGAQRTERHPTTDDYQVALRLAFCEGGLPDRLAVDHDSVFYDNTSKSPFPTRLHLWLLALGIELTFARVHRPTDQAVIERSHQTWQRQVLAGQEFPSWPALCAALAARRTFLNQRLPCASLGERPPLVAHPQACQPRRLYRPEWEAELLDLARVYHYLGQGRWFRRASNVGTVSLGGQVYPLGRAWRRAEVEITFQPADQQLLFRSPSVPQPTRRSLRGVTPATLLGAAGPLGHLDAFQLALPFSGRDWHLIRFCETLGVTT